jgi:hypothetical protein
MLINFYSKVLYFVHFEIETFIWGWEGRGRWVQGTRTVPPTLVLTLFRIFKIYQAVNLKLGCLSHVIFLQVVRWLLFPKYTYTIIEMSLQNQVNV